jgi:hypothetical protein
MTFSQVFILNGQETQETQPCQITPCISSFASVPILFQSMFELIVAIHQFPWIWEKLLVHEIHFKTLRVVCYH